jgi:hypothetical protein
MALALYHNIEYISCKILPYSVSIKFDIEWFVENDFSIKEILKIRNKFVEIYEHASETFIAILWPPAQDFFNEIVGKIGLLEKVISYKDYEFDELTFEGIVRLVYLADDTPQWKVEKKLERMKSCKKKRLRLVFIKVEKPHFILWQHIHTSSLRTDCLKKVIRNGFMKKIDNYFFDIIIHMSDYFAQNNFTKKLFTIIDDLNAFLDVKGAIQSISQFNYALVKLDTPFIPKDFPNHWNLYTDIDILCSESEYYSLVNSILKHIDKNKNGFSTKILRCHRKDREIRTKIRINLMFESCCVFQFDICSYLDHTKNNFIMEALKYKVYKDSFYAFSSEYEYIVRLIEIYEHPYKKHHFAYIKEHNESLNERLCDTFLDFNWRKFV